MTNIIKLDTNNIQIDKFSRLLDKLQDSNFTVWEGRIVRHHTKDKNYSYEDLLNIYKSFKEKPDADADQLDNLRTKLLKLDQSQDNSLGKKVKEFFHAIFSNIAGTYTNKFEILEIYLPQNLEEDQESEAQNEAQANTQNETQHETQAESQNEPQTETQTVVPNTDKQIETLANNLVIPAEIEIQDEIKTAPSEETQEPETQNETQANAEAETENEAETEIQTNLQIETQAELQHEDIQEEIISPQDIISNDTVVPVEVEVQDEIVPVEIEIQDEIIPVVVPEETNINDQSELPVEEDQGFVGDEELTDTDAKTSDFAEQDQFDQENFGTEKHDQAEPAIISADIVNEATEELTVEQPTAIVQPTCDIELPEVSPEETVVEPILPQVEVVEKTEEVESEKPAAQQPEGYSKWHLLGVGLISLVTGAILQKLGIAQLPSFGIVPTAPCNATIDLGNYTKGYCQMTPDQQKIVETIYNNSLHLTVANDQLHSENNKLTTKFVKVENDLIQVKKDLNQAKTDLNQIEIKLVEQTEINNAMSANGTKGWNHPEVLLRIANKLDSGDPEKVEAGFNILIDDIAGNDLIAGDILSKQAIMLAEDTIRKFIVSKDTNYQFYALRTLFALYDKKNCKISADLEMHTFFGPLLRDHKIDPSNLTALRFLIDNSKFANDQIRAEKIKDFITKLNLLDSLNEVEIEFFDALQHEHLVLKGDLETPFNTVRTLLGRYGKDRRARAISIMSKIVDDFDVHGQDAKNAIKKFIIGTAKIFDDLQLLIKLIDKLDTLDKDTLDLVVSAVIEMPISYSYENLDMLIHRLDMKSNTNEASEQITKSWFAKINNMLTDDGYKEDLKFAILKNFLEHFKSINDELKKQLAPAANLASNKNFQWDSSIQSQIQGLLVHLNQLECQDLSTQIISNIVKNEAVPHGKKIGLLNNYFKTLDNLDDELKKQLAPVANLTSSPELELDSNIQDLSTHLNRLGCMDISFPMIRNIVENEGVTNDEKIEVLDIYLKTLNNVEGKFRKELTEIAGKLSYNGYTLTNRYVRLYHSDTLLNQFVRLNCVHAALQIPLSLLKETGTKGKIFEMIEKLNGLNSLPLKENPTGLVILEDSHKAQIAFILAKLVNNDLTQDEMRRLVALSKQLYVPKFTAEQKVGLGKDLFISDETLEKCINNNEHSITCPQAILEYLASSPYEDIMRSADFSETLIKTGTQNYMNRLTGNYFITSTQYKQHGLGYNAKAALGHVINDPEFTALLQTNLAQAKLEAEKYSELYPSVIKLTLTLMKNEHKPTNAFLKECDKNIRNIDDKNIRKSNTIDEFLNKYPKELRTQAFKDYVDIYKVLLAQNHFPDLTPLLEYIGNVKEKINAEQAVTLLELPSLQKVMPDHSGSILNRVKDSGSSLVEKVETCLKFGDAKLIKIDADYVKRIVDLYGLINNTDKKLVEEMVAILDKTLNASVDKVLWKGMVPVLEGLKMSDHVSKEQIDTLLTRLKQG